MCLNPSMFFKHIRSKNTADIRTVVLFSHPSILRMDVSNFRITLTLETLCGLHRSATLRTKVNTCVFISARAVPLYLSRQRLSPTWIINLTVYNPRGESIARATTFGLITLVIKPAVLFRPQDAYFR